MEAQRVPKRHAGAAVSQSLILFLSFSNFFSLVLRQDNHAAPAQNSHFLGVGDASITSPSCVFRE